MHGMASFFWQKCVFGPTSIIYGNVRHYWQALEEELNLVHVGIQDISLHRMTLNPQMSRSHGMPACLTQSDGQATSALPIAAARV